MLIETVERGGRNGFWKGKKGLVLRVQRRGIVKERVAVLMIDRLWKYVKEARCLNPRIIFVSDDKESKS